MALHLTFGSIVDAASANMKIFENYARSKTHVLRTATSEMVPVDGIAAGELLALVYVVPSTKNGVTVTDGQGQSDKWAEIQENAGKPGTYFFIKPDDSLMAGVVFDTEEEPTAEWYPDEDI